jgi:hypothetical protein
MPKSHVVHSTKADSEPQNVSTIIKLAADRVAVERACRLIDSYVQETHQQQGCSHFDPAELRWPPLN